MHQVPHAEHMESLKWRTSKHWRDDAVLFSAYPFTSQRDQSKIARGNDGQIVSCHCYLVVFHTFVEQLTVFHTSGRRLLSSESSTSTSVPLPVYFNRKPVTNTHTCRNTYIHTYILVSCPDPFRKIEKESGNTAVQCLVPMEFNQSRNI